MGNEGPIPPTGEDVLSALADAARSRPASPPPPPPEIWIGWRFVIFLMHAWAVILFALGLLCSVGAMLTVGIEPRPFRLETDDNSFRIYGWGLPAAIAVVLFLLSKLQSRSARRLRARKLGGTAAV